MNNIRCSPRRCGSAPRVRRCRAQWWPKPIEDFAPAVVVFGAPHGGAVMTQHTIDGPLPASVRGRRGRRSQRCRWSAARRSGRSAVPFADQLTGVRLISVHHLGFGVPRASSFYDIRDLALAWVWWLLDDPASTGRARRTQLGGTVAAELAVQQPQRVSGGCWPQLFGLFRRAARPRRVRHDPARLIGALCRRPDGDLATGHFPVVDDAHGRGLQAVYRFGALVGEPFPLPIPDTGISERLYRIADVPVHLVWGAADGVTPVELLEDWHAVLPHADTTVVATAAHMVPYETPEAIAAAITGQL